MHAGINIYECQTVEDARWTVDKRMVTVENSK